jgi:hypothetical protein
MTAELESKVLTVTEEKIIGDLKRGVSAVTLDAVPTYSAKSEALKPYEVLDDRLDELPSVFCNQGIDILVEWMYTMDLDRELFSINSAVGQVNFSMDEIPRDRWTLAFEKDKGDYDEHYYPDEAERDSGDDGDDNGVDDEEIKDDESNASSSDLCREAKHEYPMHAYFADNESREECKATYRSYNCCTVQAKTRLDKSKTVDRQILTVVMFEKLISPFYLHLRSHFRSWSYKDAAFRELAFAILSFAAGQYRFDELQSLEGQITNGYLVDRNGRRPELLPLFGSGCHSLGEEAGSAPHDPIYWFENVLVSLVPDYIIQDDSEAAMAKAVEFGLKEDNPDFYAVVFSLINAIMLHVTVEDGVTTIKRTSKTEISALGEGIYDPLEVLCERRAGFISLIHFFDAAADRYVAPFSQGRFPTEVYSKILANVDDDMTYRARAKVSMVFRAIHPDKIMFGKHLTTVKFSAGLHSKKERWIFRFQDGNTESVAEVGPPQKTRRSTGGSYWSPIIGMKRPSIIPAVEIWFETQNAPTSKPTRGYLDG